MYIVIDDTYGPTTKTASKFVTEKRRTHVGVIFKESKVVNIRKQINGCIDQIKETFNVAVEELHFVDIYNRNPPWSNLENELNLNLFETFAKIYNKYQWPTIIQTVDDRTLSDHGINNISKKIGTLNLAKREDLSLYLLLNKIKPLPNLPNNSLNILVDQGRYKPGTNLGDEIFKIGIIVL